MTSWSQVWRCSPTGLELLDTIECTHGAILSLVTREDILYAGCQDGYVRVWDLQTNGFIRTIMVQEVSTPLSSYCDVQEFVCIERGRLVSLHPRI
jgi:di- and tripeptidase